MSLSKKKIISAVILSVILLSGVVVLVNNVLAQADIRTGQPYIPGRTVELQPIEVDPITGEIKENPTTPPAGASTETSIANVMAWILFYIATFFSWLVSLLIKALVEVANYNHFLDQQVVINGWAIVRDVANNFFIVILLVIAVGTILRIPNYNRQLLPKLLVMAALINFSKMFTGILIDFSQIITLWFAVALKGVAEDGNIILFALGLDKLYRIDVSGISWTENVPGLTPGTAIRTLFFALILSVVAVVVVAIIMIILIYRIVMLWFLVILSPLAFLLTTFPKGQQYAGQWWGELSKYLVVGPVMLFFLYLSFFSGSVNVASPSGAETTRSMTSQEGTVSRAVGLSELENKPVKLFDFFIIIGLMVGSLVMGQKTGVAGAQWASKGIGTLQKWGKGATLGTAGLVGAQSLQMATAVPGVRSIPILGRRPGQAVDQRKVRLAATKAKAEQDRINTRAGALKVDGMNEEDLRKLAKGGDKYARIAATRTMMQQGMFRDDDKANRAENIKLINDTRKLLPPELAATFNDSTKKYNPGLAHETVYKDDAGKFKTDAFASDVRTGKIKAYEMVAALDKSQIEELNKAISANPALKAAGQANLGKFLLNNVSEKDLSEMNGELTKESRDEVWKDISHTTWERKKNPTTGEDEITDSGKKMRDKFNKSTNFNNVTQTYDKTNKSDVESIRNFVANNSTDIGKKMRDISDDFVESFGDLINPSQFKDQAPAIKEKLQKSFEAVINKIADTDITIANKSQYQKKIKHALMSGAKFQESNINDRKALVTDPVTGATSMREVNFKKREILQGVMETSSVKDVENMRGLNKSKSQMELAGTHINVNVIKGLSVSADGSVLASDLANEVKDQARKAPTDPKKKDRADKLKDI